MSNTLTSKYPNHVGFIWARESNENDTEIYSIKEQVEHGLDQAKKDGVPVPPENIFRVQFSGVDLFRIPELAELWRRLEADDQPKIIYCWVQDRLIRGKARTDIFYITTRCREANAKLFLVKKQIELTSASIGQDFEVLVDGHKAQSEIEDILDRTWRRGRLRRMKEGKISNAGPEKYGFRRVRETGKAVIVEAEAAIVRKAADLKEQGYGFQTVAKKLIDDGIPSPNGKAWSAQTVRQFFVDPAYKGEGYGWRYSKGKGKPLKTRNPDDWVRYADDAYPAIIQPERWDKINEEVRRNRGDRARNDHRFSLLRGLVFCSCGHRAYFCQRGNKTGRGKGNYDYYACGRRHQEMRKRLPVTCPMMAVSADKMEVEVWSRISELLADSDQLADLLAAAMPEPDRDFENRIELLQEGEREKQIELQRLAGRLRQATELIAGHIEREMEAVESERRLIARQIAEVRRKISDQSSRRQWLADVQGIAASLSESKLKTASKPLQRQVLEALPFHYIIIAEPPRWEIRVITEL